MAAKLFATVTSSVHPNDQIRGAIEVAKGVGFTISMDPNQEVPPTGTQATGTGVAVLDSSGLRLLYRATITGLSDSLTAAHFHSAPLGVSAARAGRSQP